MKIKQTLLKLFKNKVIRYGVLPLILLGGGIALSFLNILTADFSLTTLSYKHVEPLKNIKTTEILANEVIPIEFVAQENHLGIVSIPINSYRRKNQDFLTFRIKEKGAKTWHYENTYDGSKFGWSINMYPFGFPVIQESKDKTYQIQLISSQGSEGNGVGISDDEKFLVSRYSIPKPLITQNPRTIFEFIFKKITFAFSFEEHLYSTILYLFPFIAFGIYLLWDDFISLHLQNKTKKLVENHLYSFPFLLYIAGLYLDICFIHSVNSIFVLSLMAIWIGIVHYFKFNSTYSYILGFLFLLTGFMFLNLMFEDQSRHSFNWSFIFFTIGLITSILELRKASNI